MTRVLFTHSYSMTQVRGLCELGEFPRHHLWGADALERAGFDVRYGFFGRYRRALRRLSWSLGGRLGDIEQQVAMWREASSDTVVYAAEANIVRGLTRLRRAGWRVPIVAIVHGSGRWAAGLDVAVCLTSRMRAYLIEDLGRDPELTPLVPWGPDLSFERYRPVDDELVVSTGKTERDVDTLVRALDGLGVRARVYVPAGERPSAADGVELVPSTTADSRPLPYAAVLDDMRRASIAAIPLRRSDRVIGLSEIGDALALGKPIVMTRTDAIDFDPAEIGCGFSVAPRDVAAWREALGRLAGDAALRREMGRRARGFAERSCNAERFGEGIVAAVRKAEELAGRRVRRRGRH